MHNARWRKLAQDIFETTTGITFDVAEQIAATLFEKGWVKDSPSVIDTVEALNELEAGRAVIYHGAYGPVIYLRAVEGIGAVWRESGNNRNRFVEDIPLPVTLLEES